LRKKLDEKGCFYVETKEEEERRSRKGSVIMPSCVKDSASAK
jgi:hypothetical protein